MFTKKLYLVNITLVVMALAIGAGTLLAVKADEIDTTSCDVLITYYQDADSDGYGNPDESVQACSQPEGYTENNTDCDDDKTEVNPGAIEICDDFDNNCDGNVNEGLATSTYYRDLDGDSYGDISTFMVWCELPEGYALNSEDCNDAEENINPGAAEVCDGADNDCDGDIDEGVKTIFYQDADNDGYGNPTSSILVCTAPNGYVLNNEDCNDSNADIHPGAVEVCDGLDNDCDGQVDEDCPTATNTYYRDADNDGYGDPNNSIEAEEQPHGYVADNTDCNDSNADIHPGAVEVCDGLDNDCDGDIDEGVKIIFYHDVDGDGYGDSASSTSACEAPAGYVANANDCDDTVATVNPGATEVCDGLDNDCDNDIDEGVKIIFYYDADGDGYGNPVSSILACTAPNGCVLNNEDCDDTNAAINPGAVETCDGLDNDCDGQVDEDLNVSTYYRDADNDGYGDPGNYIQASSLPDCYVTNNTDCDDTKGNVHPGAVEACDGIDNNCNGQVDEGCTSDEDECECECECECTCTCNCNNGDKEEFTSHCPSDNWFKNHGARVSCWDHLKKQGKKTGCIKE